MTTDGGTTREHTHSRHLEYELRRTIQDAERRYERLASRLAAVDLRAAQVVHRLRAAGRVQTA
jgi:chromosome segregation ATPase